MADNDYNVIKPVEGLINIAALDAVKHREERKRKNQMNEQKNEEADRQKINSDDEQTPDNEAAQNQNEENPDTTSIDYHA